MRTYINCQGQEVGYIESVQLGQLWRAVAYGKNHPPPMFGMKGDAMQYVHDYGSAKCSPTPT